MNGSDAGEVHATVRAYAESQGAAGRRWLEALPTLVQRQCQEWRLERYETLPGGSRSSVCRVTTARGERAVLKLALPEPIVNTQVATLVAAQGRGYALVFAHDLRRGALLLESLGSPVGEDGDDVARVLALTAGTLARAWQSPGERFLAPPSATDHKAAGLFALVSGLAGDREDAGLRKVVERALGYACERLEARDPGRQVVVHGDPHAGNLLPVERSRPGAETGYVFVDPEGFVCEPEYDLGVALRGWNAHLLAADDPQPLLRAWCEELSRASGTSAEAIWQWAYLERVSTGLYLRHHGLPQLGVPFLSVAARL